MKLMGMHGKVHDGHCNGNIYYNMHGNDCDRNEHENAKKNKAVTVMEPNINVIEIIMRMMNAHRTCQLVRWGFSGKK